MSAFGPPGSPGSDSPGPAGPDRDVERLLSAALARDLGRPVDTQLLLDGARSRAHRIRRRRTVVASALGVVLVAGVPLGLLRVGGPGLLASRGGDVAAGGPPSAAWSSAGSSSASPAATEPRLPVATATAATAPVGTSAVTSASSTTGPGVPVPTGAPASGTAPYRLEFKGAVVTIPETAVLQAGDLKSVPLLRINDLPALTAVSTDALTICPAQPSGRQDVVGGRRLDYAERSDRSDQWTVTTAVRVMKGDAAGRQLTWLQRNLVGCQGGYHLTAAATGSIRADGAVLGYQRAAVASAKSVLVVGVIRQGRTTAEVLLQVPAAAAINDDTRLELALAQGRRLLQLAQQRLVSSGLAAAAQAELT